MGAQIRPAFSPSTVRGSGELVLFVLSSSGVHARIDIAGIVTLCTTIRSIGTGHEVQRRGA